MATLALHCPLCTTTFDPASGLFACPQAAEGGGHHILHKTLRPDSDDTDHIIAGWMQAKRDSFAVFGHLMTSHALVGDGPYRALLHEINTRLEEKEGQCFSPTPLTNARRLARAIHFSGPLWVKDETGNIAGSHKARHLMGSLLYLAALDRQKPSSVKPVLAIYSCGNAALGAAAVASAGGFELHAFVPEDVHPAVEQMMHDRGTIVDKIQRRHTGKGDPCHLAYKQALAANHWQAFACAGDANWSNIEGGATLGWEMVLQLIEQRAHLDHLIVQVGGGALARATAQAWQEMATMELIDRLPQIHVCQPRGAFPFVRAYYLALAAIAQACSLDFPLNYPYGAPPEKALAALTDFLSIAQPEISTVVAFAKTRFVHDSVQSVLNEMLKNPQRFMWAWDGPAPRSLAHGILDDVTYDWYYLLCSLLKTGGRAVIISEEAIAQANHLASTYTTVAADHTGTAGLAGLLELMRLGVVDPAEAVGLLFTGIARPD